MHGIKMVISGSAVLFVFKVSIMTPAVLIRVQLSLKFMEI